MQMTVSTSHQPLEYNLNSNKPPYDYSISFKNKKLKMHCSKLLCTTVFQNILQVEKNIKWSFDEFAALQGHTY